MSVIIWFIFVTVSHFTIANQSIFSSSIKTDGNSHSIPIKNSSNDTQITWFLYPPWKLRNDFFNDKPYNNSVEYFGINNDDYINNESFLESSKITACNEILLSFYSKVNGFQKKVNLILFLYKQNVWKKESEYRNNDSQWSFHQFQTSLTTKNEDIQFRFLPISSTIAIAILNISTHTNCQHVKSQLKSQSSTSGSFSSLPFLFLVIGGTLLLIFIIIMILCIYGIIERQCNRWGRKRSSRRRRQGRKARNTIRDESSVISLRANLV